jgi:phenylalanyl-tRNA synthetase alpha chain
MASAGTETVRALAEEALVPATPEELLVGFRADLARATDPAALDEVRRVHTGKKSALKDALTRLREVSADERPAAARALNEVQRLMEAELDAARDLAERAALAAQLDAEWQDLTLPGLAARHGALHPVTLVHERCLDVLRRLGFTLEDGPEVETAHHNFDALNIPEHHPARDMQDTFWVSGGLLLRSHTTTVQARVLSERRPLPIKIASAGRVYRNEAVDATHLAMFHQLEGLWVEPGLAFSDLKGILAFVARELFGDHPIRFKPKYYPYTEPSVGVDVQCTHCHGAGCGACHGAGWVTILGSGMVHPKVFLQFGYDPSQVSGLAFGLGTTRMAAQAVGTDRLRMLYEQDLRVHRAAHRRDS